MKINKGVLFFLKMIGGLLLLSLFIFLSHYYLQLCQNNFSFSLVNKFIFSWHTEKFLIGSLILMSVLVFISSLLGSLTFGAILYSSGILLVGLANYLKLQYREEPLYPDDFRLIGQFSMWKDLLGWPVLIVLILVIVLLIGVAIFSCVVSLRLSQRQQIIRVVLLLGTVVMLVDISQFNQTNNWYKKQYSKTALWIPYSQKMNYYNVGFVGGFLDNLKRPAMEKPKEYSKDAILAITKRYQREAEDAAVTTDKQEAPNIIFIMSESFSDPQRVSGIHSQIDPLHDYRKIAKQTFSGQMLSQNYGGGTANIEFEALTGFSMEPLAPQLNTPYTMLVPKLRELPSIVSLLGQQAYQTTAIHPYNTSMYKRQTVYQKIGFTRFIAEKQMKNQTKIKNNPYIADEAAFNEVYQLLAEDTSPQFIHLVTMQTHMPYAEKYPDNPYTKQLPASLAGYFQDIDYTSRAIVTLLDRLTKLPRRTLVVFWGDHLPSIYSQAIVNKNTKENLHLTEFFIYDSKNKFRKTPSVTLSPIYFGPQLFQLANKKMSGFYQLLAELSTELPAFEKQMYLSKNGKWQRALPNNQRLKQVYQDYCLLEYDILAGKQYSLQTNFFKETDQ